MAVVRQSCFCLVAAGLADFGFFAALKAVAAALKKRFPAIVGPHKEDICYATTNRQLAVKEISPTAKPETSNSGTQEMRDNVEAAITLRQE